MSQSYQWRPSSLTFTVFCHEFSISACQLVPVQPYPPIQLGPPCTRPRSPRSYPLASEAGQDDEEADEEDEEAEDPAGLHRVGRHGRPVGGEQRGEALHPAEVEQAHRVDPADFCRATGCLQRLDLCNQQEQIGEMVNGEKDESTCIAIGCSMLCS